MEATKKIVRIDGKNIEATERDINQAELLFYKDNPRIKTIVETTLGDAPSQADIEKLMKGLESVKTLRQSILANDGLLEPITVKDNVVLEGNSRLAAYRLLAATDPIKWGKIRAVVLPSDVTDSQVFSMLGTLHIIGKTPWTPFEQAGYLYRRMQQSRKSIEGIAQELGMSGTDAKRYVQVYQLMRDNDDTEPKKWSYYFEMYKNPAIKRANENYPQYNLTETLIEMIKEDKFADAKELRKVGIIVSATGENAEDAITQFLSGEITIDEGVELVSAENKLAALNSQAGKILDSFKKDLDAYRSNLSDPQLKFKLKSIQQQLKHIFGE